MSVMLQSCAGTVHVITSNEKSGSSGFYKMKPPLPTSEDGKCLITGAPLTFQEIVQPSVTLDDKRYLYVFGSAWSPMSVNGILLLGKDSAGGTILNDLISWYETNRVSKLMNSITLSISSKGLEVFVVGMQLGQVDPMFNKQEFSISLLTSKDA